MDTYSALLSLARKAGLFYAIAAEILNGQPVDLLGRMDLLGKAPAHRFNPVDLLYFVESKEFTTTWTELGLDDEDDLESLQRCIMAEPHGDGEIDGSGGLRIHTHAFEWNTSKPVITAYYGYFEDYGVVYLTCVDEGETIDFSSSELLAIRESLTEVRLGLERRQTFQ